MVKFVCPAPIRLAPREPSEQKVLVDCPGDPMEGAREEELAMADVDRVWQYWTWGAEETQLALSCPDLGPAAVYPTAPLPATPHHLPRGAGTDRLLREVRSCPNSAGMREPPSRAPSPACVCGVALHHHLDSSRSYEPLGQSASSMGGTRTDVLQFGHTRWRRVTDGGLEGNRRRFGG